jgi:hypothetical protein
LDDVTASAVCREWPAVTAVSLRPDLRAAQAEAWRHVVSPGASWSGAERAAIAQMALAALDDRDPLPPWTSPTQAGRAMPATGILPDVVVDAVYRIARHAASLTEGWYRAQIERGIDPLAYVEIVGVVSAVAAVDGFFRAIGLPRPPLPPAVAGTPHGRHPEVEPATLNWVPVEAPADQVAAVVQGLSAAPDERALVMRLAAAQYIPFDEMGELGWSRGTLSRGDMELVAARLSAARECFY